MHVAVLSHVQVIELEGKLKHEQLMHTVTKNQLKSVEDENIKLRKRLLLSGSKRRGPRYAWGINTQLINKIVINLYVDYVINSDLNCNHKVIRQKNALRNHFESC